MFYHFELTCYPRLLKFYTVTRNTVWEITEQEHLIIFIREGSCIFSCNGETRTVNSGDIVYIPANQPYIRKSIDHTLCTMTYVHFLTKDSVTEISAPKLALHTAGQQKLLDNAILSNDLNAVMEQPIYVYLQTFFPNFCIDSTQEYLDTFHSLFSKRLLITNLQLGACLCSLLALLSQKTLDTVVTTTDFYDIPVIPPKLKRAVSYIVMHYSEPISLEDLSNHCSISKQQLIRYFHHAFHTTPNNYITDFKLSRAKELLFYHPELSIKEVALELGFDNQHYFSRVFMKKNGETPSQYRDRTINFKAPDESS